MPTATRRAATAPNTGTIHYPAGTGFPRHSHDFAQVWYVLEGECRFGDRTLTEGDMVYLDPGKGNSSYGYDVTTNDKQNYVSKLLNVDGKFYDMGVVGNDVDVLITLEVTRKK